MTRPSDDSDGVIDTNNYYGVCYGRSSPNTSAAQAGMDAWVHVRHPLPTWRYRQDIYLVVAYLLTLSHTLPEAPTQPYTFEQILDAVRNV